MLAAILQRPQAQGAERTKPPYGFLAVTGVMVFAADALTKLAAVRALGEKASGIIDVASVPLGGARRAAVELALRRNDAGAWSMLHDTPAAIRQPFFVIVSLLAIAFIVRTYRAMPAEQRTAQWGFGLVLGGALGNLFDRIRDASVVDFIHAHAVWGGVDHEWPTFNVADVAIGVGVFLLLLGMLKKTRQSSLK
jgi:signal peptidase II